MSHIVRSSLLILSFATALPLAVQGPAQAGAHDCCCHSCRQPCGRCQCAQQTAYQPVVETQYAQQPVWQHRDVVATEYRTEPTVETVPTTVMENVMVDEGGYQTVWVPRMTTRAVARTVYQSRTAYRTVPYQVTHRVAECTTQTVPYQSVRYVPSTSTAIGCATTPGYASLPPVYSGNSYSGHRLSYGSYPTLANSPIVSAPSYGPSYTPRYAEAPVTPIAPRTSAIMPRSVGGSFPEYRTVDRSSQFVPAPSAAQVWRSTAIR